MTCGKCQNKKCNCSCQSKGKSLVEPCGYVPCKSSPECPEWMNSDCVFYSGESNKDYCVNKGEPLTDVLEKIQLKSLLPSGCFSNCSLVYAVRFDEIGNVYVKLSWNRGIVPPAGNFKVYYKKVTDSVYLSSVVTGSVDTILLALTPNTEYDLYIEYINGPLICRSLNYKFKTNN